MYAKTLSRAGTRGLTREGSHPPRPSCLPPSSRHRKLLSSCPREPPRRRKRRTSSRPRPPWSRRQPPGGAGAAPGAGGQPGGGAPHGEGDVAGVVPGVAPRPRAHLQVCHNWTALFKFHLVGEGSRGDCMIGHMRSVGKGQRWGWGRIERVGHGTRINFMTFDASAKYKCLQRVKWGGGGGGDPLYSVMQTLLHGSEKEGGGTPYMYAISTKANSRHCHCALRIKSHARFVISSKGGTCCCRGGHPAGGTRKPPSCRSPCRRRPPSQEPRGPSGVGGLPAAEVAVGRKDLSRLGRPILHVVD